MKATNAKRIEAKAAHYYGLRDKRLVAQREVDAMEKIEKLALSELEVELLAGGAEDHAGGGYAVTTRKLVVPQVVDVELLWSWGQKKDNRKLLKLDVIAADWRTLTALGVKVPGVEAFTKATLIVKEVG